MSAIQGSAVFAEIGGHKLRLRLDRWWSDAPRALVCGCNPSDAGAERNDPTIHNTIKLAQALPGIGGFTMMNWLPYIATDPAGLHRWREALAWNEVETWRAICRENVASIREASTAAGMRLVAWGNLVPQVPHTTAILAALSHDLAHDLFAFGVTKDGAPKHPLARGSHRIAVGTPPVVWRRAFTPDNGGGR